VTDENYSFYGSVVEQSFWCQINYFQPVAIVKVATLMYFGAFEHSISNYFVYHKNVSRSLIIKPLFFSFLFSFFNLYGVNFLAKTNFLWQIFLLNCKQSNESLKVNINMNMVLVLHLMTLVCISENHGCIKSTSDLSLI
jgi:hypothetical protein